MSEMNLRQLIMKASKEIEEIQMMREMERTIDEVHDLKKRVRSLEKKVYKRKRR